MFATSYLLSKQKPVFEKNIALIPIAKVQIICYILASLEGNFFRFKPSKTELPPFVKLYFEKRKFLMADYLLLLTVG